MLSEDRRKIIAEDEDWSDEIPCAIDGETTAIDGSNGIYQKIMNRILKVKNLLNGKEPAFVKNNGFNMVKATDRTSLSSEEIASMALMQEIITFLKEYSDAGIAGLVDASPIFLDTLKELSDAIDNNPNYASDMVALLASKLGANAQAVDSAKLGGATKDVGVTGNSIVQRSPSGGIAANILTLGGFNVSIVNN